MPTTAHFTVRADIVGGQVGPMSVYLPATFSTSVGGLTQNVSIDASPAKSSVALSTATRYVLIQAGSSVSTCWRVAMSTADAGILCSATAGGAPLLIPVDNTGSTINIFTTGASTFQVRLVQF